MKSNFGQLLFGYGADGSIKEVGIYAHNDWFEMLIDMGLLGVFVYGLFWTVFFIEWRKHKLDKDKLVYYILGGMLIVLLPRTFFSMLYSHLEITAGMLFSYCIFLSQRNNLPRIEKKSDNQLKSK
jgi:O-antigen ligase